MANKKLGFIPLYRSIKEHWVWNNDEPFSKGQAWIDLLLSVNHEDKKIKIGCTIVTIHAGQMWTSYVKLARSWGWSRKRVYRFINMLKSDGMILMDGTANGTLLTLVNYGKFAYSGNTHDTTNDTTDDTTPGTTDDTTSDTQTITINNINNDRKLKKDPAPPSPGEGYEWNEYLGRWVAPPKNGGVWQ